MFAHSGQKYALGITIVLGLWKWSKSQKFNLLGCLTHLLYLPLLLKWFFPTLWRVHPPGSFQAMAASLPVVIPPIPIGLEELKQELIAEFPFLSTREGMVILVLRHLQRPCLYHEDAMMCGILGVYLRREWEYRFCWFICWSSCSFANFKIVSNFGAILVSHWERGRFLSKYWDNVHWYFDNYFPYTMIEYNIPKCPGVHTVLIFLKIFLYFWRFWQWIFFRSVSNIFFFQEKNMSQDFSLLLSHFFLDQCQIFFLGSIFLKICLYFWRFWQWIFLERLSNLFLGYIFLSGFFLD